jgi:hypothetical protein
MNVPARLVRRYFNSVAAILLVTAVAKLGSAFGHARILDAEEPVFGLGFRHVFIGAAVLEILVAFVCAFAPSVRARAMVLAWVGASFVIYRVAIYFIGYQKPCPCLGTLTEAIGLSPTVADTTLKVLLVYFIGGSSWVLLQLRRDGEPTQVTA